MAREGVHSETPTVPFTPGWDRPQVHAAKEEVQYKAQVNHLRHSRFVALRDDKIARDVVREGLNRRDGDGS
jgi:hypothetical protein